MSATQTATTMGIKGCILSEFYPIRFQCDTQPGESPLAMSIFDLGERSCPARNVVTDSPLFLSGHARGSDE